MNRITEAELFDFCVRQKNDFSIERWLAFGQLSRAELAACALLLASVDWYGHRAELREVADRIYPGITGKFSELIKLTGFDCARFSSMLRKRLELDESRLSGVAAGSVENTG
jgi:hypothetical protein